MSLIKTLHMIFAALSICSFVYRGILKIASPDKLNRKWLKVLPHINDTLLLFSAVYLVIASQQYPEMFNWVSAKIVALLFYIIFGLFTLRFSKTVPATVVSFILALATFVYIVAVALTKQAWPLML
jgi:uncharacterized membrane protein SirB2